MLCKQCGAENEDSRYQCEKCGEPLQQSSPQTAAAPGVPDYLVWAILATVFCCMPFGIISIVFAAQVNGKLQAGDYEGAVNASNSAKLWAWVSFGCVIAVFVISCIIGVIGGLMGVSHSRGRY